MRTYELMVVFAPDIAEDEMPGALERVSAYITTGGGEVSELTTTSPWGRRRLAYPIRDFRDGFYALYLCNLPPEGIGELERDLGLNSQVLRSLVTSYTPPKPKKPKKGAEGDEAESETEDDAATEGAAIASPSGASMDTDVDLTTGPQGEDLTEPPTAETPAAEDESESEPARA
ncbi:MAG: 30S ribosomal protein S6 [Thermomicrobia bacterium]|nr:30S ribosomal protein S6 [Thermomicrobia bacterium]